MNDGTPQNRTLSLRLPEKLAADLKQAASQEANTPSAVARRLIAAGLMRELRAHERDADEGR